MAKIDDLKVNFEKLCGYFNDYKTSVADLYEDSYFYGVDIVQVKNILDETINMIPENFVPEFHKIINYSEHYKFENTTNNFVDILSMLKTGVTFFRDEISAKIEEASKKAFDDVKQNFSSKLASGGQFVNDIDAGISKYERYDGKIKEKYRINLEFKTSEERADINSDIRGYKKERDAALNSIEEAIPEFLKNLEDTYMLLLDGIVKNNLATSLEKPSL